MYVKKLEVIPNCKILDSARSFYTLTNFQLNDIFSVLKECNVPVQCRNRRKRNGKRCTEDEKEINELKYNASKSIKSFLRMYLCVKEPKLIPNCAKY